MELRVHQAIEEIAASAWNSLAGTENPFLRHEFLAGLEAAGCVREEAGWLPVHLALWDRDDLIAAAPAYLKAHSWGEFVFDFAWADAYQRQSLAYYPKLIMAVPFSPVTGARILTRPGADAAMLARTFGEAARTLCEQQQWSSAHWLFLPEAQAEALGACDYARRTGFQFHWTNAGYGSFEDFLAALSAKKRKNIRQERRQVAAQGFEFVRLSGLEASERDWLEFDAFYRDTFHYHGNIPSLNVGFFRHLGAQLGEHVLLVQARRDGRTEAAALFLHGGGGLYGRYWGARDQYPGLHFETCYYQGIEYCIEQGLQRFEPGAQGEHKIARGFLPAPTYSMHWLADSAMRAAIGDFLARERAAITQRIGLYQGYSPFRKST